MWPHLGQPCQKQPSTKTVVDVSGKTKSGLPVMPFGWICHLDIPPRTKIIRTFSSVDLFPLERMRDIILERVFASTVSAIYCALVSNLTMGASKALPSTGGTAFPTTWYLFIKVPVGLMHFGSPWIAAHSRHENRRFLSPRRDHLSLLINFIGSPCGCSGTWWALATIV